MLPARFSFSWKTHLGRADRRENRKYAGKEKPDEWGARRDSPLPAPTHLSPCLPPSRSLSLLPPGHADQRSITFLIEVHVLSFLRLAAIGICGDLSLTGNRGNGERLESRPNIVLFQSHLYHLEHTSCVFFLLKRKILLGASALKDSAKEKCGWTVRTHHAAR